MKQLSLFPNVVPPTYTEKVKAYIAETSEETTSISVDEALANSGYESLMDIAFESIVPATCSHGCEVEPDGTCSHGNESVLLAYGLI